MKLSSLIKYQCWTTIKPLICFKLILFGIVAIGYLISFVTFGSLDKVMFNGLEYTCLIYLFITGSLGFTEDFKMAIQNGFTRKQIFIAVLAMFAFVATVMALVDTILFQIMPSYVSLFQQIYGPEHNFIIQTLILVLVYFLATVIAYLSALICNKIGKKVFYLIAISLGLFVLIILPLILNLYVPKDIMASIGEIIIWIFGYSTSGTIHFINPIISTTVFGIIVCGFAFITIKRTELK